MCGSQAWIKLRDTEKSEFNFSDDDNDEAEGNGDGDHSRRIAPGHGHSLWVWLPELLINFAWGGFQEQILKVIVRDGTAKTYKSLGGTDNDDGY